MENKKQSAETAVKWCFIFLILLHSVFTLHAQETKKSPSKSEISTEITLQIKGLSGQNSITDLEKILSSYPKKILSHVIDKGNNSVTVLISEKISLVDLLQVLELGGYHAAYLNEKNEYVALDPDDEEELGRPADIK